MSTPANVLSALQTQLKNSTDLSYINDNNILLGVREGIIQYPTIVIEPLRSEESDETHNYQDIWYYIAVVCYIKTVSKDKQIVGSGTIKGIADVENDIKKAISSDRTLNAKSIWLEILTATSDFREYPVRSLTIEMRALFRQNSESRT